MDARWFFVLFLGSGACSLVYQVVWVRLCMAQFGTTVPSVSAVLSVFMAGIALGSLVGGALARRFGVADARRPLLLYAVAELAIGFSAFIVPWLLGLGRTALLLLGRETTWSSLGYLVASSGWITLALLPFCVCMGATFPLAMAAIRAAAPSVQLGSFGYLYTANVLGAALGAFGAAFVAIELLGFRGTLRIAAASNALLAAAAFALAMGMDRVPRPDARERAPHPAWPRDRLRLALLFATGMVSMALEVVWVRTLAPYLGTVVYAFATILVLYLAATFLGAAWYRRYAGSSPADPGPGAMAWWLAGATALLALPAADPRLPGAGVAASALRAVLAIAPFCFVLGQLTPGLVDRASRGDPSRAGRAYAMNAIGCIIGPLLGGFVLLPFLGERRAVWVLASPLLGMGILLALPRLRALGWRATRGGVAIAAAGVLAMAGGLSSRGWATLHPDRVERRDYEGTSIVYGPGMERILVVNGAGMAGFTQITKMMVHLPLVLREQPPKDALIICFGIGTSFRSALSWGIPVTSVELVPSVPEFFGLFYADARRLLARPRARVVIDDGRRFLERSQERWDLIVVDPPPPIEAAGSSLLYSREFDRRVRERLRPGGILQHWIPEPELDPATTAAIVRALLEVFPHVRGFFAFGDYGIHLIASEQPIASPSPAELLARLPAAAIADVREWLPSTRGTEAPFQTILRREISLPDLVAGEPLGAVLTDDRPVNEYYLLRRLGLRTVASSVPRE